MSFWDDLLTIGTGGISAIASEEGPGDFLTAWTGGETSEQEGIRKEREKQVLGTKLAQGELIGGQYWGPLQSDIEELRTIDQLLGGDFGIQLTGEEIDEYGKRRAVLQHGLEEDLGYDPYLLSPQFFSPYEVETYDPVKAELASELGAIAFFGDEKFRRPDYEGIPEYEKNIAMQDPSEAAKARADIEGLAAQRAALRGIEDIYKQGGMTAIDRARWEEQRRMNEQLERAGREAIMGQLAQRGMTGGGYELQALLSNQQAAAERQQAAGLGIEAQAQQRAMDALLQASGAGQQLAEDVYRREFETGGAEDIVNQFNTLGTRELQADIRRAQDLYVEAVRKGQNEEAAYYRSILERDIDRLQNINTTFAADQTAANQWEAAQKTESNRELAERKLQGEIMNQATVNTQRQWEAGQNWGTVGNVALQQGNLANIQAGYQALWDAIQAQRPTDDYGKAIATQIEIGKTIGEAASGKPPSDGGQGMADAFSM